MCIIEGIQNFYEIRKEKGKILLLLRTNDGIDVSITLGYENSEEDEDDVIYYDCAIDKIYNEWCKAIGKQIPETENEECEENEKCEQNEECKKNNNVAVWVAIIFFFAGGIFLFKSWLDFDDTKYFFPAIGSIGCAIWCIKKILF